MGQDIAGGAPAYTYALAGWPLAHSLSPAVHNAAFAAAGRPDRYVLCPTPPAALEAFVTRVRAGDLAGANVTVPHKLAVRRLVDEESHLVRVTGAVNTLVRTPTGVRGENTDVAGCLAALAALDALQGAGRRALVLGAGGAARAVALALVTQGFEVLVMARRVDGAAAVAETIARAVRGARLSSEVWSPTRLVAAAGRSQLLANCTPIGAAACPGAGADAGDSPWPASSPIPPHLTVLDVVAWPQETPLVMQARAAGARAGGGLAMLVGQAAQAWRLWTRSQPSMDAMWAAARAGEP
jgi:shikimate dehydrogenase